MLLLNSPSFIIILSPTKVEFCNENLGETYKKVVFRAYLYNPKTREYKRIHFEAYVVDCLVFPSLGPGVGLIIGADVITTFEINVNDFAQPQSEVNLATTTTTTLQNDNLLVDLVDGEVPEDGEILDH